MKVIPLLEDEGFKEGFKGEQERPLVDKKNNFPGVRVALERQEADSYRREGRSKDRELEGEERETRTEKQAKGNETSFFII